MAATRLGNTITLTADADALTGVFFVIGMTYAGTGLTSGQRIRITDATGDLVADYYTSSATGVENADLWNGRKSQFVNGLTVEDYPASGGVITVFLE